MNKLRFSVVCFFGVVWIAACKHDIPEQPPGNGENNPQGNPCTPGVVYFTNEVLPFLVSNCAIPSCHDATTSEDGVQLDSYAAVMSSGVVTPGNPGNSDLWEVLTEIDPDKIMPPPSSGINISAAQIEMIQSWIQQGAQNNSCTAACDPSEFGYAAVIGPLISTYCQGCHSGTLPSGGMALTNYSQIRSAALSGALMAGLTGTQGVPLMPLGTSGLSTCQIEQVNQWIDAGAPNN